MFIIIRKFLQVEKSQDAKRNLKVLMIASALNLSFAVEKILLANGINLGDAIWACIYGGLAIYTTYVATHDYVLDTIENTDHTPTII